MILPPELTAGTIKTCRPHAADAKGARRRRRPCSTATREKSRETRDADSSGRAGGYGLWPTMTYEYQIEATGFVKLA